MGSGSHDAHLRAHQVVLLQRGAQGARRMTLQCNVSCCSDQCAVVKQQGREAHGGWRRRGRRGQQVICCQPPLTRMTELPLMGSGAPSGVTGMEVFGDIERLLAIDVKRR